MNKPLTKRPARFKEKILLLFVALLPVSGTDYLQLPVSIAHVSILDFILLGLAYFAFMEQAIIKEITFKAFIKNNVILLSCAAVISCISLFYIQNLDYDIKLTLNLFRFILLILLIAWTVRDSTFFLKLVLAVCISVFIISAAGVLKSLGMDLPGGVRTSRIYMGPFMIGVTGITARGMSYSTLAIFAFPFLLSAVVIRKRIIRWLFLSVIVLAAVISFSRGLWIAIAVEFFIYLFFSRKITSSHLKRYVISASIVAFLFVSAYKTEKIYNYLFEIRPQTVNERIEGYTAGFDMVTSNSLYLLFGAGKGEFVEESAEHAVPHNMFIDLLVSKGIIVTLLLAVFYYFIAKNLFYLFKRKDGDVFSREISLMFIDVLIGFLVFGMVAPLFNSLVFWTAISFMCSYIALTVQPQNNHPAMTAVTK
jgi:hypothetical protein